jgi:hypothetical protein
VVDFFNVPRLPAGAPGELGTMESNGQGSSRDGGQPTLSGDGGANGNANEFNIQEFMVDANRDWLFKQEGAKFLN